MPQARSEENNFCIVPHMALYSLKKYLLCWSLARQSVNQSSIVNALLADFGKINQSVILSIDLKHLQESKHSLLTQWNDIIACNRLQDLC